MKNSRAAKSVRNLRCKSLLIPLYDIAKIIVAFLILLSMSTLIVADFQKMGLSPEMQEDLGNNIGNFTHAVEFGRNMPDQEKFRDGFYELLGNLIRNGSLGIIAAIATIIIANTFIWNIVSDKKLAGKQFAQYAAVFLIWNLGASILLLMAIFLLKKKLMTSSIILLTVTYLYMSLYLYPLYAVLQNPFKTIKSIFPLAITRIHRLFPGFLLFYIGMNIIAWLFKMWRPAPILTLIGIPLALFFLIWVRYYTYEVIKDETS